jgi:DNA-binding Lrp family transcriptional regulator
MNNSRPETQISDALMMYTELGFDAIPLIPGDKKPLLPGWQSRAIYRLWREVPANVNIGLRGGGLVQAAFIDCDEKNQPGTFEIIQRRMAGLGYMPGDYPVVSTASGVGRHIYVTFTGELPGDWRNLSSEVGEGEFRYGRGAFVAAPPSVIISGYAYTLVDGDLRQLPNLALNDILPLLCNQEIITDRKSKIPRLAFALLNGKGIERYRSRSETEQAILASLANVGFSFSDVLDLFNHNPAAGKYAEMRGKSTKNAERWLQISYSEALHWTRTHESKERQIALAAIEWAGRTPWPGRTGAVDRTIFIAHMQIAYRAGRLTYAAACRDLAERAGVNSTTATNATRRLCEGGLLTLETKATVDYANIYGLSLTVDELNHSPSTPTVRKWLSMSTNHDVFRQCGLGKSAGEVWQVLQDGLATINELAERTGRHERTVKRSLERMAKLADPLTGECLPMVARIDGEVWQALPVDLDRIAHIVGTADAGERQRRKHIQERQAHKRSLLLGRKNQTEPFSRNQDGK